MKYTTISVEIRYNKLFCFYLSACIMNNESCSMQYCSTYCEEPSHCTIIVTEQNCGIARE